MIRIVKMTFAEAHQESFVAHFEEINERIKAFPGCSKLALVRSKSDRGVFFTISEWESEEALAAYRTSTLFQSTWAKVKPMFAAKAEAWSTETIWAAPKFV